MADPAKPAPQQQPAQQQAQQQQQPGHGAVQPAADDIKARQQAVEPRDVPVVEPDHGDFNPDDYVDPRERNQAQAEAAAKAAQDDHE